jgi:hypothetical protein
MEIKSVLLVVDQLHSELEQARITTSIFFCNSFHYKHGHPILWSMQFSLKLRHMRF